MSEKNEALRLADALEISSNHGIRRKAAAELRRQHEEITELRHGAGVANQTIASLVAQRDALLAALKSTGLFLHHCWCDVQMNDYSFEKLNQQMAVVDTAIQMVEEGK